MDFDKRKSGPKSEENDFMNACRVCMMQNSKMNNIFDTECSIKDKIEYCTGLQCSENDGLPSQICDCCLSDLSIAHRFKTACILANNTFHDILNAKVKTEIEIEFEDDSGAVVDDEGSIKQEPDENVQETEDEYLRKLKHKHRKRGPYKLTSKQQQRLKKLKFKRLWCEPCDLKFESKLELEEHKKENHKEKESWICEFCGKVFGHRGSVASHLRSHRPPEFACDRCDYKTWYKHDLAKHLMIHGGEKKFHCASCPTSYYTSSNLKSHVRRCHDREKRFSCTMCDARFFDRTKYNRHIDSHNNIKRFECEVCHSCFTRRCYWKKHLERQHSIHIPTQRPGKQRGNDYIENAPT